MTKFLVLAVFLAVWFESVLGINLSLLPGVSAKNLTLYLALGWIVMQAVLDGREGGVLHRAHSYLPLHLAFVGLIVIALASSVACLALLHYPGYTPGYAIAMLKGYAIDPYLMFFVFLAGIRNGREAVWVARIILAAMSVGTIVWILDLFGLVDFGIMSHHWRGRIQGPMGDANQIGSLVVFYMLILVAVGLAARGVWRIIWLGAAVACMVVMFASASRGAVTALVGSALIGGWLIRDRIKPKQILAIVVGVALLVTIAYLMVDAQYKLAFIARWTQMGTQVTIWDQSSGRSMIWGTALATMQDAPLSLLVGMGWKTFDLLNRYASHSDFVELYFNLGIVGLLAGLFLYFGVVRHIRRATRAAAPEPRAMLTGFLFAFISFLISSIFVNMHAPLLLVWSFTGLMLRLASDPSYVAVSAVDSDARLATQH
jgi:O-antigen ligase